MLSTGTALGQLTVWAQGLAVVILLVQLGVLYLLLD